MGHRHIYPYFYDSKKRIDWRSDKIPTLFSFTGYILSDIKTGRYKFWVYPSVTFSHVFFLRKKNLVIISINSSFNRHSIFCQYCKIYCRFKDIIVISKFCHNSACFRMKIDRTFIRIKMTMVSLAFVHNGLHILQLDVKDTTVI